MDMEILHYSGVGNKSLNNNCYLLELYAKEENKKEKRLYPIF